MFNRFLYVAVYYYNIVNKKYFKNYNITELNRSIPHNICIIDIFYLKTLEAFDFQTTLFHYQLKILFNSRHYIMNFVCVRACICSLKYIYDVIRNVAIEISYNI